MHKESVSQKKVLYQTLLADSGKGSMYDMFIVSRCKEYGLYNGTPDYYGSTRTILLY